MNLLLLSGNSRRGKEWLQQVDLKLAPQFENTYSHDYAHWENGEPEIDLNIESSRLDTFVQDLYPYMVFAKSAGTILASKGTAAGILHPKACLFVGLPLVMIRDHNLPANQWLQASDFPITILQHTNDPLGSYEDTKRYIDAVNRSNVTLHELPGETHDYLEFGIFENFTIKLTQQ